MGIDYSATMYFGAEIIDLGFPDKIHPMLKPMIFTEQGEIRDDFMEDVTDFILAKYPAIAGIGYGDRKRGRINYVSLTQYFADESHPEEIALNTDLDPKRKEALEQFLTEIGCSEKPSWRLFCDWS